MIMEKDPRIAHVLAAKGAQDNVDLCKNNEPSSDDREDQHRGYRLLAKRDLPVGSAIFEEAPLAVGPVEMLFAPTKDSSGDDAASFTPLVKRVVADFLAMDADRRAALLDMHSEADHEGSLQMAAEFLEEEFFMREVADLHLHQAARASALVQEFLDEDFHERRFSPQDSEGKMSVDSPAAEECVEQIGLDWLASMGLTEASDVQAVDVAGAPAIGPSSADSQKRILHNIARLLSVWELNAYLIGRGGETTKEEESRALFPCVSLIDHGCVPSVRIDCSRGGVARVIAARNIREGEELRSFYPPRSQFAWHPASVRCGVLEQTRGFRCHCSACGGSESNAVTTMPTSTFKHAGAEKRSIAEQQPEKHVWSTRKRDRRRAAEGCDSSPQLAVGTEDKKMNNLFEQLAVEDLLEEREIRFLTLQGLQDIAGQIELRFGKSSWLHAWIHYHIFQHLRESEGPLPRTLQPVFREAGSIFLDWWRNWYRTSVLSDHPEMQHGYFTRDVFELADALRRALAEESDQSLTNRRLQAQLLLICGRLTDPDQTIAVGPAEEAGVQEVLSLPEYVTVELENLRGSAQEGVDPGFGEIGDPFVEGARSLVEQVHELCEECR